jgi:iron-sulfur cluster assembly protein
MSITISERAAKRIHEIRLEKNVSPEIPLRVSVMSGGCSGLTYDLDFDSQKEITKQDKEFEDHGVKVVVDMRSFLYLAGTNLDYTDGLTGQGFHFHNPNAVRSCSCGESFSL